MLHDRCGELIQGLGVHEFPRLIGTRLKIGQGHLVQLALHIRRCDILGHRHGKPPFYAVVIYPDIALRKEADICAVL